MGSNIGEGKKGNRENPKKAETKYRIINRRSNK